MKYAIRLRNHGGRTNNGDGGLNCVKGSDNTTFAFSTCSLSFNGTTLTRGQIPVILYYRFVPIVFFILKALKETNFTHVITHLQCFLIVLFV